MVYPVLLLFSLIRSKVPKISLTVKKKLVFTASIRLELPPPCRRISILWCSISGRQIKNELIQLFKDWTDYSQKLVNGELVKKDGSNALLPPSDTGETVGLNPYRLTLTFGVSASFLTKLGLEKKTP